MDQDQRRDETMYVPHKNEIRNLDCSCLGTWQRTGAAIEEKASVGLVCNMISGAHVALLQDR